MATDQHWSNVITHGKLGWPESPAYMREGNSIVKRIEHSGPP